MPYGIEPDINDPAYIEKRQLIELEHCHYCDKHFHDGVEVSIYSFPEDEFIVEVEEKMCPDCQDEEFKEQIENQ